MAAGRIHHRIPVVVVGESLNSLGILRSLAGLGLELHVVTTTRWCGPALSRHARATILPSLDGRDLVDGLKALAQRLGRRAVLMLCGDRQVDVVNEHRDELALLFQFTLPPPDMLRRLANKATFQQFALEHGLDVPRTAVIGAGESVAAALRELTPPLVLKPADKVQVLNGHAERAVRVESRAEAEAVAARMLAGSGCVVAQEWIVGHDSDIYFALFVCDRQSRVVGMFCGRKLVCDPPEVGSTGICVDAGEHSAAVAREAVRFVQASGYQGIGSVEYKRDRRSGRFVIVEPTVGRSDWQEEIATHCGVNLPLQAYLAECGLPPQPPRPMGAPQAWSASLFYPRPRALLPAGVRIRDGYLRWSDPLPGLHHYLVEELGRRSLRKLGRLLHGAPSPVVEAPVVHKARP
jgi:predicted ATP-grasp superfamily ATP-dependent carboligase